ncbi:4208_t:CDS:2 [Diversispora eburnea]|uniref:4208_t:CDS:1 n=1 Tax=Diversispora eburnea TaxID=1213867 RepID=A0A9N8YP20_9GLOM|nr:4208_t:CDS:2 [Diversispora eburnea]
MEAQKLMKRKRNNTVEVSFEEDPTISEFNFQGPFLASFHGIPPPQDVEFNTYQSSNGRKLMIAGENSEVIFASKEYEADQVSEYMIAIYDKTTNIVTFRPAPVIDIAPIPKRLKLESNETKIQDNFLVAKTALDKEFGSKKMRSKILSRERGKIDASQVQEVEKIVSNIEETIKAIPTEEDIKVINEENRPIPPYNINAVKVADVYKLDDIVSPIEFEAIPVQQILRAKTNSKRLELLPFKSNFINDRLLPSLGTKEVNKKRIKILLYINYLMAFRSAREHLNERGVMLEKLKNPPDIILKSLYERYTETSFLKTGGRQRSKMTSKCEDKLLCYMFVLCLMLEVFRVDPEKLIEDLTITAKKAFSIFRTLGCKVEGASKQERESIGLNASQARHMKRAVLTIPLVFPEPSKKRFNKQK